MRTAYWIGLIAAGTFACMTGRASAALFRINNILLEGSQEAPTPVATPGTGLANLTYDPDTNELSWNITFQDLLAGTTAAHFHGPAPIGVPAGVNIPIGLGTALGQTSGLLQGSATVATEDDQDDLLGGLWYINIHSTLHTGGEIRGQVPPFPEPATVLLLTGGTAALLRRRHAA